MLGIGLMFAHSVFGQIIINEFQIEPEQSIELWNSSNDTVDLGNWVLDDSGGTTFYTIPPNSLILPFSCLVFTANFNLNRTSSDQIRLFNAQQLLVDSHVYDQSPGLNQSWQRIPHAGSTWQSGESTLSKNNTTGESCIILPALSPTPTPVPTPLTLSEPTPSTTPSPVSGIYLNEALVNPEGEPEWVEIYNHNDFAVELSNWYLDDDENSGATPKQFSLTLSAGELKVLEFSSAVFNNDRDSVRLLNSEKLEIDSFEYENSEKGESYSRQTTSESVWCKTTPSREKPNHACLESPSQLVLGNTLNPSPTQTITKLSPLPKFSPPNLVLGAAFHSLNTFKPKVLGANTGPKNKEHRVKINQAIRASQLWFFIHLSLNLGLILYILCYYYGQKTSSISPV